MARHLAIHARTTFKKNNQTRNESGKERKKEEKIIDQKSKIAHLKDGFQKTTVQIFLLMSG